MAEGPTFCFIVVKNRQKSMTREVLDRSPTEVSLPTYEQVVTGQAGQFPNAFKPTGPSLTAGLPTISVQDSSNTRRQPIGGGSSTARGATTTSARIDKSKVNLLAYHSF